MRTLIVIPIIHTERDMGSLLGQIEREYVTRYGRDKWTEHLQTIDEVWTGIQEMVVGLQLPYALVRVYQDGLPVCGKEAEIVRDVANSGSRNHRLIADLLAKGARLMGTEDPQLLMQEYQLLKTGLASAAQPPERRAQLEAESRKLLADRDRFIAARINDTLSSGEIGLLFLGMAHAVEEFLPSDLLVRHLLPSLRSQQAAGSP